MNCRFKKAIDYCTYHLTDFPAKKDRSVLKNIAKLAKWISAQIKPNPSRPFDTISIIEFLKKFILACDTGGVHGSAAVWLFHFFWIKTTSTVLNTWLSADSTDQYHS